MARITYLSNNDIGGIEVGCHSASDSIWIAARTEPFDPSGQGDYIRLVGKTETVRVRDALNLAIASWEEDHDEPGENV